MKHNYDIHINYDEIDLISDRIEEIQNLKDENGKIPEEFLEEYACLFKIKNMLFEANRIVDPKDYLVYGTMRVNRKDIQKLMEMANKVHIKGLELYIPTFTMDDLAKNTDVVRENASMYFPPLDLDQERIEEQIKNDANLNKIVTKIRNRRDNESIPQYEDYLKKLYSKYMELEMVSYYPGTTVEKIRKPYPHEMYYPTDDGFKFDSKYFGRRNKYYLEMVDFYTKERDKQLEEFRKKQLEKEVLKNVPKNMIKVTNEEEISNDISYNTKEYVSEYLNDDKEKIVNNNIQIIDDDNILKTTIKTEENNKDVILPNEIEDIKVDSLDDLLDTPSKKDKIEVVDSAPVEEKDLPISLDKALELFKSHEQIVATPLVEVEPVVDDFSVSNDTSVKVLDEEELFDLINNPAPVEEKATIEDTFVPFDEPKVLDTEELLKYADIDIAQMDDEVSVGMHR